MLIVCSTIFIVSLEEFEAHFLVTYKSHKGSKNNCITNGIIISCRKKINIYASCRNTGDLQITDMYLQS